MKFIKLIIASNILLLHSCGWNSDNLNSARLVPAKYYEFYNENDIDSMLTYFTPYDTDQVRSKINSMHSEYGYIKSTKFIKETKKYTYQDGIKIKIYEIEYEVLYDSMIYTKEVFEFYDNSTKLGAFNIEELDKR